MGVIQVAVKQLKENASENDKIKFLQEAAINGQFHHRNVVNLLGVVTVGEPVSSYLYRPGEMVPRAPSHHFCTLITIYYAPSTQSTLCPL